MLINGKKERKKVWDNFFPKQKKKIQMTSIALFLEVELD
jgi:hypothetical protein